MQTCKASAQRFSMGIDHGESRPCRSECFLNEHVTCCKQGSPGTVSCVEFGGLKLWGVTGHEVPNFIVFVTLLLPYPFWSANILVITPFSNTWDLPSLFRTRYQHLLKHFCSKPRQHPSFQHVTDFHTQSSASMTSFGLLKNSAFGMYHSL
jgi:hypothetical protein